MALVGTDKRSVLRQIKVVSEMVRAEISAHAARGSIASGLAREGFAGGYYQALIDVEAALTHGYPSSRAGYWERARAEIKGRGRK